MLFFLLCQAVRVNGSLFIHVYFLKAGHLPNFTADDEALIVQDAVYGSQCEFGEGCFFYKEVDIF